MPSAPPAESDASLSPARFRKAMGCFATGIAIVSIRAGDAVLGLTVNSLASVSLRPPLILWCLGREADRFEDFYAARDFGLNILSRAQEPLSRRCAEPGNHRLKEGELFNAQRGTPLLHESVAGFDCAMQSRLQAGDHVVMIAGVRQVHIHKAAPLIYHQGNYASLASA